MDPDRHHLTLKVFRLVSIPMMVDVCMESRVPTSSVGMFILVHMMLTTCIEMKMFGTGTINLFMFQCMVGMLAGFGLVTMALHFGHMMGLCNGII